MNLVNSMQPQSDSVKRSLSFRVFGIGGAGGNAIQQMSRDEFPGVHFYAFNTDVQALQGLGNTQCHPLGSKLTRGLGTGGDPELGRAAAEEDIASMKHLCEGADVVFILAGLGGGTG